MTTREIIAWVRRHGERLVEPPPATAIPQPGDVDFDQKMRDYQRWEKEYEVSEEAFRSLKSEPARKHPTPLQEELRQWTA